MSSPHDDVRVCDLVDDALIAPFLETDRGWAAYAVCDLEQPFRAHARYIGARRGDQVTAIVLVFSPPGFTSLVPCGAPRDVEAILASVSDLPKEATVLAQWAQRDALARRFEVLDVVPTVRMIVTASTFCHPSPAPAEIVHLTADDLPRLERLYAHWPDAVFARSMFAPGFYFGAVCDGELVAVAGTHAISQRYRMGVIGNVFTLPTHRGMGFGSAVTGASARALIAHGADQVALNVRENNDPAVALYTRLGFACHETFFEATIVRR